MNEETRRIYDAIPIIWRVALMKDTDYEVVEGIQAVWINANTGECIARFGVYGVDIHRRVSEQSYRGECLDCRHGVTTLEDWKWFKERMLHHYNIDMTDREPPDFLFRRKTP